MNVCHYLDEESSIDIAWNILCIILVFVMFTEVID